MINWSAEIVEKYVPKSVQNSADLVPGRTYYSNSRGIIEFIELRPYYWDADKFDVSKHDGVYISYRSEDGQYGVMCPTDHNMNGGRYNPWMLFENEDDYLAYVSEIDPTIWYDNDEMLYDDWYSDYEDYEG